MAIVGLSLGSSASGADDEANAEAARLLQTGDVMSKEELIKRVHARHAGKVVDTELRREGQGYVYLVRVLDGRDDKQELKFDAKTGDLLTPDEK
jgi:uncharacterized membrane protein YkoI